MNASSRDVATPHVVDVGSGIPLGQSYLPVSPVLTQDGRLDLSPGSLAPSEDDIRVFDKFSFVSRIPIAHSMKRPLARVILRPPRIARYDEKKVTGRPRQPCGVEGSA